MPKNYGWSLNIQTFEVPGDNKPQKFAVLIKQLKFSENNLTNYVDELAVQDVIHKRNEKASGHCV